MLLEYQYLYKVVARKTPTICVEYFATIWFIYMLWIQYLVWGWNHFRMWWFKREYSSMIISMYDVKVWSRKNVPKFHMTPTVGFVIWKREDVQNKEKWLQYV